MKVIQLQDGPNAIDLDGNGAKDMVFLGWRGNGNAHDVYVFTFYVYRHNAHESTPPWNLVPIYGLPNSSAIGDESFPTSRGAECVLSDLRIVQPIVDSTAPITLIIGERAFGDSYADSMPVKFFVFDLVEDTYTASPPFRFKLEKTIPGRTRHCDINEAFAKELGLGPYRPNQ